MRALLNIAGVVRRNPLVMFMCIELMLNAVNLTLISAGRAMNDLNGQVAVFFILVVAAAGLLLLLRIAARVPSVPYQR